jgi:hypothetical protein
MEVLSYLELQLISNQDYVSLGYGRYFFVNKILSIKSFYSQPFKPELITELFAGWEFVTINSRKQYQNYIEKDVLIIIAFNEYQYVINGVAYHIPRTLNDFINDASRAGIELQWRVDENE